MRVIPSQSTFTSDGSIVGSKNVTQIHITVQAPTAHRVCWIFSPIGRSSAEIFAPAEDEDGVAEEEDEGTFWSESGAEGAAEGELTEPAGTELNERPRQLQQEHAYGEHYEDEPRAEEEESEDEDETGGVDPEEPAAAEGRDQKERDDGSRAREDALFNPTDLLAWRSEESGVTGEGR
jgi:hypothetical protein